MLVGFAAAAGGCGVSLQPSISQPTSSSGATDAASSSPEVVDLDIPEPVALTPIESFALPDLWAFIPTTDGMWTASDPGDALIHRDETGKEIGRIEGAAPFHGVAIAFGSAWATDFDGNKLHQYDLQTGEHTALPTGLAPDAMLVTDDALWIADHHGNSIERLDPATNELVPYKVRDRSQPQGPGGMAQLGDSIYTLISTPPSLAEVDATTGTLTRTIPIDIEPCCEFRGWDGLLWVSQCDPPGAIGWMAPEDNEMTVVQLTEPMCLAARIGDQNWALQDGMLVALEPDPLRAVDARTLDEPILWVVSEGEDVWLGLEGGVVKVAAEEFESPPS